MLDNILPVFQKFFIEQDLFGNKLLAQHYDNIRINKIIYDPIGALLREAGIEAGELMAGSSQPDYAWGGWGKILSENYGLTLYHTRQLARYADAVSTGPEFIRLLKQSFTPEEVKKK